MKVSELLKDRFRLRITLASIMVSFDEQFGRQEASDWWPEAEQLLERSRKLDKDIPKEWHNESK